MWEMAAKKTTTPQQQVQKKPVQNYTKGTVNVVSMVDRIFQDSLKDGTSDIHLEIFKDNVCQVRFRNDGIMKIQEDLSNMISANYIAA